MTETSDRLQAALADRYRIERELGQGGMATVYLAEDLKHHRKVAVKVLRPELAATLGPERFTREIEVAARLQHPHILGVLDSGDAGGFFYYVMPYVQGETLRDKLARGGELPVMEAVRLLGEIAEALATAHRSGVVHRDIKPENVLLSGRHAMVMDFGVAKAVTEASGPHTLTSAGVALGTPAYMAPEQASADPHMDARVDIYAVGVMAYEMLTGATPFPGLNAQQTLAAHVTRAPVPVGQQREGLSPALEAVVMRCLAKRAADRFQTADDLVAALEPLATPSGGITPTQTQPVSAVAVKQRGSIQVAVRSRCRCAARCRRRLPVEAVGASCRAPARQQSRGRPAVPDRRRRPERAVPAAGNGGPDAGQADRRRRSARGRCALGAGRRARRRRERHPGPDRGRGRRRGAEARRRPGPARQHRGLGGSSGDERVARGRARREDAGADQRRGTQGQPVRPDRPAHGPAPGARRRRQLRPSSARSPPPTSTPCAPISTASPPIRRAVFQNATPLFSRAVELDSTFALALSMLIEADGWHLATTDMQRVRRLAWQYRDRLNPQDQLFLSLRLGSRYPKRTPWNVRIADAEHAVQVIPESADAWFNLGDFLFHFGRLSDIPEPEVRARQAFEQAFQRDSLYGAPIQHMSALTWAVGDTAAQRLWTARLIALDSAGEGVPGARWNLLQATRDEAGIAAFLKGLDSGPVQVPQMILFFGTLDSVTIANRDALLAAAHRLSATKPERAQTAGDRVQLPLEPGAPRRRGEVDRYSGNAGSECGRLKVPAWRILARWRTGGHHDHG